MKKILLLFVFFTTFGAFAQDAYIVDKKGKKTFVRNDAVEIINIDKRISYKLPGKTWEKYITYKDLDYAMFGQYYFKSFTIDGKKTAYFVLAEDDNRKLVGISIQVTTTSGTMSSTTVYNYLYVVENDTTILYDLLVKDLKNKKNRTKRTEIPEKIKSYFPDCNPLHDRIDGLLQNDEDPEFMSILSLVENPVYLKCN